MNEKDFVTDKIKCLVANFSDTVIGYEYDSESLIHFIKIKPIEIYENKDFKKLCSKILLEYIDNYRGSLCFISDSDQILLDNPEIFIYPGKSVIKDQHYRFLKKENNKMTSSISSPNKFLNNKYSLAA